MLQYLDAEHGWSSGVRIGTDEYEENVGYRYWAADLGLGFGAVNEGPGIDGLCMGGTDDDKC